MTLSETEFGKKYIVVKIDVSDSIKRRIFDIGLTKGSLVTPLYCSFLGEPTAYLIRGAVIALRDDETKRIFVKPVS
ncbi:MAG: ferrous iron transport protein A [Clostridia bacterium]|nr:ferrous iron transport protein A [Clostridia bacterium]